MKRSGTHVADKGPKQRGLKGLKSSHEIFNTVLSYRRYRLTNLSKASRPKVSAMIGQYQRLMRHPIKAYNSSGDKTLEILQLLSALNTTFYDNDILDGAAVRLLSKDLNGAAKRQLYAYDSLGTSRVSGFASYPEAVQHLLKSFATKEVIIAAEVEFDSLTQGEK